MFTRNIHKIRVLNRYYKITRFYEFIVGIALKTGLIIGLIVLFYILLDHFVVDIERMFHVFSTRYSPLLIFSVFFTSEIFLGLIPPELFIAWTSKTLNPWFHVFLLSTLSYLVGLFAFYLGKKLFLISVVKKYLENKVSNHIRNLKKWGGVFIVVGAMLPVPYSMVSLTSGLINYQIKHYMLWSLFRYLRFFLYAIVVFKMI